MTNTRPANGGRAIPIGTPACLEGAPVAAETATASSAGPLPRHLVRIRRAGILLIAAQLGAMLAFSTYQFGRFSLTLDFGYASSAWWSIAHGHLDPWASLVGSPYWKNNAEFFMWPLSLLYHVAPSGLCLLWVQDLAVCAAEVVALVWCVEILHRARRPLGDRARAAVLAVAIAALVLDPWAFETIAFDFHFEPVAAFFLVVTGHALWAGRTRRLWWSVPLTLVSGVLGGLYLLGAGASAVAAGRRSRIAGSVVAALGLGWLVLFTALGAVGGGGRIGNTYGYLTGSGTSGVHIGTILTGLLRHPGSVTPLLAHRWPTLVAFLVVVGLVGLCSVWGLGVALVVLVPSLLAQSDIFFKTTASFQVWPALPFLVVGSVSVLANPRLAAAFSGRLRTALLASWATVLVILAAIVIPAVPSSWVRVSAAASVQLARAEREISSHDEVIASGGIVGRFSQRAYVYNYPFNNHPEGTSVTQYPRHRPSVVLVLTPTQGIAEAPSRETFAVIRYVRAHGGRTLIDEAGVHVLVWSPPPGPTFTLP